MKKLTKSQKIGIMAAAALFVAAVVVVVALFAGKTTGSFRSIKIVETSGAVTISREGIGDLNAAVNMNLISGDSVHTGQDAYVVLMLDADKYVMLGESGTMEVIAEGNEASGRTSILLEQGSVLSEIQNPLGQDSSYEVVTPNATMSVRGTVFEIDRGADGLVSLLVYDGAVAMEMDGYEPVLCNAGEYMQFEEGNPPKLIVDRASISEEVINEQMRQRLEKINESGRGLNLGSAQIAENKPSSELTNQEASPEPEVTPEPTSVSEPTATPESVTVAEAEETPEPAATSKPERTPKPTTVLASAPEPVSEPAAPTLEQPQPTAAPTPAPEQPKPQPTAAPTPVPEQPESTPEPQPTAAPTPVPEQPKPTPEPQPTAAPTPVPEQPEPTPAPVQEYTVTFANPYVWVNGTLDKMSDVYEKSGTYVQKTVEAGKTMEVPEESEIIPVTNDSSVSLRLAGWYLDRGEEWNFDTYAVYSDFTLYPVWEEVTADASEGDTTEENAGDVGAKKYWTVIFEGVIQREDGSSTDICVCLPEGTSFMPKENLDGETVKGWEKLYGGMVGPGRIWNALVDSVKGVTALKEWVDAS